MKKLMFAAAAVAASVAVADVTSANIVGYANNSLQNGATMVAAQFGAISGELDLQDLSSGENGIDQVKIQFLNASGKTTNTVMWADGEDLDEPVEGLCWSDPSWEAKIVGLKIKPGQGLWVTGRNTNQKLQSAGQVGLEDVTVALCNGATACGNPFPYAYDLQDITAGGQSAIDQVKIQFLNASGKTIKTVMWADGEDLDEPVEGLCWSDPSWEAKIEGVTIQPGEGLWVTARNDKQWVKFPAPELGEK